MILFKLLRLSGIVTTFITVICLIIYYINYKYYILSYYIIEPIAIWGFICFFYSLAVTLIYLIKIIFNIIKKKNDTVQKDLKTFIPLVVIIAVIFIFFYFVFIFYIPSNQLLKKPIIYLYPQNDTEVTVKLSNPENLIHTYPKYESEWRVYAKKDGTLTDLKTNRNLYALYWEAIDNSKVDMSDGFIVAGKDTSNFLEEKLEILGLNYKESQEFIIYWLPILESNEYNFIRFRTEDEINDYMKLDISPKPDTIIRVIMDFKKLDKEINVKEQILENKSRNGFTVVEWGAREIK